MRERFARIIPAARANFSCVGNRDRVRLAKLARLILSATPS